MKTSWSGDEVVYEWQPRTSGVTDWLGIFDHEIIVEMIECHCIFAATAAAHTAENRDRDVEFPIQFRTGTLQMTYLRPTFITEAFAIRARITEVLEELTVLTCAVVAGGDQHALGKITAARVLPRVRCTPQALPRGEKWVAYGRALYRRLGAATRSALAIFHRAPTVGQQS